MGKSINVFGMMLWTAVLVWAGIMALNGQGIVMAIVAIVALFVVAVLALIQSESEQEKSS